ncbi:unnamed protein product, partial [Brenthis ino]
MRLFSARREARREGARLERLQPFCSQIRLHLPRNYYLVQIMKPCFQNVLSRGAQRERDVTRNVTNFLNMSRDATVYPQLLHGAF